MLSLNRTFWAAGLALMSLAVLPGGVAHAQQPQPDKDVHTRYLHRLEQKVPKEVELLLKDQPDFQYQLLASEGGMGVSLKEVDATLRSHLNLKEGQGVVVTEVVPDSPAAKAGIQAKDILLKLNDEALHSTEEVDKNFKSAGDKDATVALIRAGKPMTVEVKPAPKHTVTFTLLSPAVNQSDYWLGLSLTPADDTLRSHLNLADTQGLVVTEVFPDAPAAKAGFKANDILLKVGDKTLESPQEVIAQIKASDGKVLKLQLLRDGKPLTIEVTPEKRKEFRAIVSPKEDVHKDLIFQYVKPGVILNKLNEELTTKQHSDRFHSLEAVARLSQAAKPGSTEHLEKRLDEVLKELQELRKSIDDLQKAVKKD